WKEITVRCLCAAWRPLWPECVLQRDFEGFEELEEEAVVHEIVSLGNSMGLEVDDDEVEELVEEHSKELSTEELLELHKEQNETLRRSLTSEESGEDEDKEENRIIPAKDLKDAFFCWSKLSKLTEDYHPDVGSVQKAISVFNDNVMNYFWRVQKSSIDSRRNKFTAKFKLRVIEYAEQTNNCAVAREFKVSKKNLSAQLKLMPKNKCANRGKCNKWPQLEVEVAKYVSENPQNGYGISRGSIRIFALKLARKLGITDFKASHGWCTRFMKRNYRVSCTETSSTRT
ncbi:Pogo transposable element-like 53, partial [Homarus americanus]